MNKSWDSWPLGTAVTLTVQRPKVSQVVHPAEKICLAEEKNPNDARWEWANAGTGKDDELADRHAKQGNILFHDWHVERRFGDDLVKADQQQRSVWKLDAQ
jgi:prepilin-type processing-associated H-X9-DG protein